MINDYIYCVETIEGKQFYHYNREEAFEWYERNNGVKIWTKTKDLFPTINVIIDKPNVDINNIRKDDIVNETSVALRKAVAKYDKNHTKQIKLKFNLESDKDIIDKLKSVEHMQTYIKDLIRKDLENSL